MRGLTRSCSRDPGSLASLVHYDGIDFYPIQVSFAGFGCTKNMTGITSEDCYIARTTLDQSVHESCLFHIIL